MIQIRKNFTNFLLVLSLTIFIFGSGYKIGEKITNEKFLHSKTTIYKNIQSNRKNIEQEVKNFNLFWEVWDKLNERFVNKDKLDPQKMYYGAIKGMVQSLDDPYTFFMTPKENQKSKDDLQGIFEGIGAQLGLKNGSIVVISPLKDSPAEKAGLKPGDMIIKVDGKSTKNWTLLDAVKKIRGKHGTQVVLTVLRDTKKLDIKITRDVINVPSVETKTEKSVSCSKDCKKVGYIKINQFGDKTIKEWDRAVKEVYQKWNRKQIVGLVLDLRGNPGGYLNDAVYIASEFIPKGKVVVTQKSTIEKEKKYYANRNGKLLDIPVVVLIDRGSASASEILAGALRDYKRATIVGEKSFGKGSVQQALDFNDGSGLHVTIAKWILPDGDWINGKGLQPQIKIENKVSENSTLTRKEDLQLEKAISVLIK